MLHAAPYGLSSVRGEGRCPGVYQVGKGQSEWEVLTDFCAYVCGWQPRVTKDGILEACPPGQDACHLFSNEQYGGIRYSSLKRIHRPYGVIHEVRYRPDRESGYAYAMQQPEPSTATARRFLNLAQSPAWRGRREAELLLQRSLSGSEELVLEAPFSFAGELGDAASAPDGLCAPVRKDWCIWSLCYHWRPSDIGCTVTLRPKPIFSQEAIDLVDHAKITQPLRETAAENGRAVAFQTWSSPPPAPCGSKTFRSTHPQA